MTKLGLSSDSDSRIQRSLHYTMLPFLPEWKKKMFFTVSVYFWINEIFILVQVNPSLSKYLTRETYSNSSNNLELMCLNVCVYFLHVLFPLYRNCFSSLFVILVWQANSASCASGFHWYLCCQMCGCTYLHLLHFGNRVLILLLDLIAPIFKYKNNIFYITIITNDLFSSFFPLLCSNSPYFYLTH